MSSRTGSRTALIWTLQFSLPSAGAFHQSVQLKGGKLLFLNSGSCYGPKKAEAGLCYNAGLCSELVMLGCAGWFWFGMQARLGSYRVISESVTHKHSIIQINSGSCYGPKKMEAICAGLLLSPSGNCLSTYRNFRDFDFGSECRPTV